MKFTSPLELIFSAPSNISVLRVLNERNIGISGREVSRLSKLSLRTVQVALQNLENTGIVKRFAGNREHLFVLDRKKFLSQNLIYGIFKTEKEFNSRVLHEIKKKIQKDTVSIILFGSAVRGADKINSDLDVCIVYSKGKTKIEEKVSELRTSLSDDFNITLAPFYITSSKFKEFGLKSKLPVKQIIKEGKVISGKTINQLVYG